MKSTHLLILSVFFFALAMLCRYAEAEPTATGTVEVDVGPALTDTNARIDLLEATVEDLLARVTDVEDLLTEPDPTPNPTPKPDPAPDDGSGAQVSGAGMGLDQVQYWARSWPFADLFLISDAWRKDTNDAYIFSAGHPPGGAYVLIWTGSGSIDADLGVTITRRADHRIELTIDPAGPGVRLKRTGSVSDVQLVPAGWTPASSSFHPLFVQRLRPSEVIRFMDWQRINNSRQSQWSTRTLPHQLQSTRAGVAVEYMIELVNESGADPWFCMPHLADDEYVRRFAEMVRDRLHPDAKVYVEWSNEVWNSQFQQGRWVDAHDGSEQDADPKNDNMLSGPFFDKWAAEARRDFAIWREVFAGQEDRLVRVAAVHLQSDNAWVARELLKRMNGELDAIAPSGYFDLTTRQRRDMPADVTADRLADLLALNIKNRNRRWYAAHGALAVEWAERLGRPIPLITYESGQHVTARGNKNLPWLRAIYELQTGPRIVGLYRANRQAFHDAGGTLDVAYSYVTKQTEHGSFGHLEYQDQPTKQAPKYEAVTAGVGIR